MEKTHSETNIAPDEQVSQKETEPIVFQLPTIHFQGLC